MKNFNKKLLLLTVMALGAFTAQPAALTRTISRMVSTTGKSINTRAIIRSLRKEVDANLAIAKTEKVKTECAETAAKFQKARADKAESLAETAKIELKAAKDQASNNGARADKAENQLTAAEIKSKNEARYYRFGKYMYGLGGSAIGLGLGYALFADSDEDITVAEGVETILTLHEYKDVLKDQDRAKIDALNLTPADIKALKAYAARNRTLDTETAQPIRLQ